MAVLPLKYNEANIMRLYGAIEKVEPLDDGTVRVHGIASTEAVDDQGEIVRAAAMRAAIPDYMRFPAIREMHQLSAAGTALEIEVGDDNVTRLVAHVVDPIAVSKVKTRTYRGFSIGGRVTQRDAGNSKTITGLSLSEISLVDRPANPDSVFDVWKASSMPEIQPATAAPFNAPLQIWACGDPGHRHIAKSEALKCMEKLAAIDAVDNSADNSGVVTTPEAEAAIEKQAADGAATAQAVIDAALAAIEIGDAALAKTEPVEELAKDNGDGGDMGEAAKDGDMEMADKGGDAPGDGSKPYGDVKYADPGYKADGKKRYPIDTEAHVRAAWSYINQQKNHKGYSAEQVSSIKSKIRAAGKKFDINFSEKAAVAAFSKSLWDIGEVAMLIASLDAMCERLQLERAMEGDESNAPDVCEAACASACELLRALCAEETQEVLNDTEIDEPVGPMMNQMMMSVIAQSLTKAIPDPEKVEHLMETLGKVGGNRRHRAETQELLDGVAFATAKAMDVGDLKRAEMISTGDAHKAVLDAGATAWGAAITGREMLTDDNPSGDPGATEHATVDTGGNGQISVPNPTGAVPASPYPNKVAKTADPDWVAEIEGMIKANKGGKALLRAAHDFLSEACDGATCKEDAGKPAHVSGRDMAAMHKCHGHLMAVDGVKCAAANPATEAAPEAAGEAEGRGATTNTAGKASGAPVTPEAAVETVKAVTGLGLTDEPLAKLLDDERAEKALLLKALGDVVPMLGKLTARLDEQGATLLEIRNAPMPARAVANTAVYSVSKTQDGNPLGGQQPDRSLPLEQRLSPELREAFAKLSADEQTMMKIRDQLGQPIPYDPIKRVLAA